MSEDSLQGTSILRDVVKRLSFLYITYRGRYILSMGNYGTFMAKVSRNGEKIPAKLTDKVLFGHLKHQYAVGVFAGPLTSKFVCFDVDIPDRTVVFNLTDAIVARGIPREYLHVSSSGSKGYHIDIFFDQPVLTSQLKKLYRLVIADTGYSPAKVEFRPTFKQGVKLPLSVHHKTGRVAWYLDSG